MSTQSLIGVVHKGGDEFLGLSKSAIAESKIITNENGIKDIENSVLFIPLADRYTLSKKYDEAIGLFKLMYDKGSRLSTMLNDYGAALLRQMESVGTVDKTRLV